MFSSSRRLLRLGGLAVMSVLAASSVAFVSADKPIHSSPASSSEPPAASSKSPAAGVEDQARLARSLGLSVSALDDGLRAAKQAGGVGDIAIAAFAGASGSSGAVATTAVDQVFGRQGAGGLTGKAAIGALADRLHISREAAASALTRVAILGRQAGGIDPGGAQFRALAHDLAVTPQQLAAGIDAVKAASAG